MLTAHSRNIKERERRERIRKENSPFYCNWCHKEKNPDADLCYDCEQGVEEELWMEHQDHSQDRPDYYCPICRRKDWI